MTDTNKLVERLETLSRLPGAPGSLAAHAEAADALIEQAAEIARLREALTKIAALNDVEASERLRRVGSYAAFDEPGSVEIARAALATKEQTHE